MITVERNIWPLGFEHVVLYGSCRAGGGLLHLGALAWLGRDKNGTTSHPKVQLPSYKTKRRVI